MSELRECPFCGGAAQLCYGDRWSGRDYWAFVRCTECCITPFMYRSGKKATQSIAVGHAIELWNTRPASRVEAAATKFLHCVEQYHDAIKLRDDLENSHMWSAELRRMYDAMVKLRAALAAEGDHA